MKQHEGGSLRVLLCQLMGLPAAAFWQFSIDHGSLSTVQIHLAGAIITSLNNTHHLQVFMTSLTPSSDKRH